MPRQPDGSPWDGLSGPDRELGCGVSSAVVVAALERALDGAFPGSALFADYVRMRTEAAIAEVCRLGANWLQERFEGPDMFATGGEGGAAIWLTPAVQDTLGGGAAHDDGRRHRGVDRPVWAHRLQPVVDDEDLVKDDRMGAIAFSLGDLTPQEPASCAGWVRPPALRGIASVVMRIQVDGAGQNCEGLLPTSMAEVTFPRDPMTPAGSNPTATAASGSPWTQ